MANKFRSPMMGGSSFNMNQMLKQAQQQMQMLQQQQANLAQKEFDYSVGGGAVTIKCNGEKQITSLTISPETIDPSDPEMLSDLIITAVNGVFKQVDDETAKLTSAIPGLDRLGKMF
ncbi:YbaB/EbfC family nucleoid-associated protein [Amygdalobacter nucleatus]|uniref:Nucleoid-associated protein HMPREF1872_00792 n=1 Tax=Amygdalobacter nucleatus TaxID=3029274 RepID=A0A133YCI8_9FIRM|nr:YbaB/EbfC family nucleoid-associated protein [Amygdalobacter nucleatus]KXB40914.1 DNA-binding protein, YbaB/EbfC family [Amygdalobacter nucleatus]MDF0485378.1 YbaB/EbfC family nucleoid-associated protein [Amygdalobacter nucleatus]WEG36759.1 YbaB/EbfC family nucleoid-associated protein [Amygdalobacter nucleatus]